DWSENTGRVAGDKVEFLDGAAVPLYQHVWRGVFRSSRLAFYAHYDDGGSLSQVDRASLAKLRAAGFDVVVLSAALDVHDSPSGEDYAGLLIRPNVGHDFLSWRIGMDVFAPEIAKAQEVVFTNNSVVVADTSFVDTIRGFQTAVGCFAENR